jgi:hypothetical protein
MKRGFLPSSGIREAKVLYEKWRMHSGRNIRGIDVAAFQTSTNIENGQQ